MYQQAYTGFAPQQQGAVPGQQMMPQQAFGGGMTNILPSRAAFAAAPKAKKQAPKRLTFQESIDVAVKDRNYQYWRPSADGTREGQSFKYKKENNKNITDASGSFATANKHVNEYFARFARNRPNAAPMDRAFFTPVFLNSIPTPIIVAPSINSPQGGLDFDEKNFIPVRLFGAWVVVYYKLVEYLTYLTGLARVTDTQQLRSLISEKASGFITKYGISQSLVDTGSNSQDPAIQELYKYYNSLVAQDRVEKGARKITNKYEESYQRFKRIVGPAPIKAKGKGKVGKSTTYDQAFITNFPTFASELYVIRQNNATPGAAMQEEKYQSYRQKTNNEGQIRITTSKGTKRPQTSWIIEGLNVATDSVDIAQKFLEIAREMAKTNGFIAAVITNARISQPVRSTGATIPIGGFANFPNYAAARTSVTQFPGVQAQPSFYPQPQQQQFQQQPLIAQPFTQQQFVQPQQVQPLQQFVQPQQQFAQQVQPLQQFVQPQQVQPLQQFAQQVQPLQQFVQPQQVQPVFPEGLGPQTITYNPNRTSAAPTDLTQSVVRTSPLARTSPVAQQVQPLAQQFAQPLQQQFVQPLVPQFVQPLQQPGTPARTSPALGATVPLVPQATVFPQQFGGTTSPTRPGSASPVRSPTSRLTPPISRPGISVNVSDLPNLGQPTGQEVVLSQPGAQ